MMLLASVIIVAIDYHIRLNLAMGRYYPSLV